jgi:hypothetical protein
VKVYEINPVGQTNLTVLPAPVPTQEIG